MKKGKKIGVIISLMLLVGILMVSGVLAATESECGNGDPEGVEECDDGNLIDGDGCSAQCIIEYCGDGIINNIGEECDGDDFGDVQDCTDLGGYDGELSCNDDCEFEGCEYDDFCPLVEVIVPPDSDPLTWYAGTVKVKGTVSDFDSGVDDARVIFHDDSPLISVKWIDGFFDMEYNSTSGFWEYDWDSLEADINNDCSIVHVDIFGEDGAGNGAENECGDTNLFGIDNAPPETTKEVGEPSIDKETGDDYYVKTTTPITLTAEDCGSGVDYIHYEVWWDNDDNGVVDTKLVDEDVYDDEVTFYFDRESIHEIRWYAVDKLENTEEMHYQEHAVDETGPDMTKEVGDNKILVDPQCNPEEKVCDYYITQQTPITFRCEDPLPHPVDDVTMTIKAYWKETEQEDWPEEPEHVWNINDNEWSLSPHKDSMHKLVYYCTDALGNIGEIQEEIDIVESVPPIIEKEMIGPWYGDCPPKPINSVGVCKDDLPCPQEECYIDGVTQISVHVYDPEPHPVNEVVCEWDYTVEGGIKTGEGKTGLGTDFIVTFPEESFHFLTITCRDALGNEIIDTEMFIVDKTKPETTKEYGDPVFPAEGYPKYINFDTLITLNAFDPEPHPSGIKETWWRNTLVDDEYCEDQELCYFEAEGEGDWILYDAPFSKDEESCHLIEYYSIDNVNKTEDVKKQCVFIDNTGPLAEKTVGDPKYPCEEGEEKCGPQGDWPAWFVTPATPIFLECEDPEPHPVNNEKLCYKISFDEGQGTQYLTEDYCEQFNGVLENDYCCLDVDEQNTYEFHFMEESLHNIEWWCEDALGNKGEESIEYDNVDDTGPQIDMKNPSILEAPNIEDCSLDVLVELTDMKSGVNENEVYVTITPEGEDEILLGYLQKVSEENGGLFGGDGYEEVFDIQGYSSGNYTITVYAEDNLGNLATYARQITLKPGVFVDLYDLPGCNVPSTGGTCDLTFHACIRDSTEIDFYMGKIKDDLVSPLLLNGIITTDGGTGIIGLIGGENGFSANKVPLNTDCSITNGKQDFVVSLEFTEAIIEKIGGGAYNFDWEANSYLYDICIGQTPD